MKKNLGYLFKYLGNQYFLAQTFKNLPYKDFASFSSHYYFGFHGVEHPLRQHLGMLKHCQLDCFAPGFSLPPIQLENETVLLVPITGEVYIIDEEGLELTANSAKNELLLTEVQNESYFRIGSHASGSELKVLSIFLDGLSRQSPFYQTQAVDELPQKCFLGVQEKQNFQLNCEVIALEKNQKHALSGFEEHIVFAVVLEGSILLNNQSFRQFDSFEMAGNSRFKEIESTSPSRLLFTFQERI